MAKAIPPTATAERVGGIFFMNPHDLTIVGADLNADGKIDGPEHPLYDPRVDLNRDAMPQFKALVADVAANGVRQPIICRKNGDQLEVAEGRQRTFAARAAIAAGATLAGVKVEILQAEQEDLILLGIACNEIRVDSPPYTKAKNAAHAVKMGLSKARIAKAFGFVNEAPLNALLNLLTLHPKVIKALENNKISYTGALELVPIAQAKQVEALGALIEAGGALTKERVRAAARNPSNAAPRPGRAELRMLRTFAPQKDDYPEVTDDDVAMTIAYAAWFGDGDAGPLKDIGRGLYEAISKASTKPPKVPKVAKAKAKTTGRGKAKTTGRGKGTTAAKGARAKKPKTTAAAPPEPMPAPAATPVAATPTPAAAPVAAPVAPS